MKTTKNSNVKEFYVTIDCSTRRSIRSAMRDLWAEANFIRTNSKLIRAIANMSNEVRFVSHDKEDKPNDF